MSAKPSKTDEHRLQTGDKYSLTVLPAYGFPVDAGLPDVVVEGGPVEVGVVVGGVVVGGGV